MEILPASSLLNAELLSESSNLSSSNEHRDEDSGLVGVVERPPAALPRLSLERDIARGRVDTPSGIVSERNDVAELR